MCDSSLYIYLLDVFLHQVVFSEIEYNTLLDCIIHFLAWDTTPFIQILLSSYRVPFRNWYKGNPYDLTSRFFYTTVNSGTGSF